MYVAGLILFLYALTSVIVPQCFGLTVFGDAVQCLLLLACYASTLPNQMRGDAPTRRFWTLMSAGFGLWLLMQALWTFYEVVLRKDIPDLFWGDAILFLHVLPMMLAFAARPHARVDPNRREIVDSGLMAVWTIYAYVALVLPWQYVVPDTAVYNQNFNLLDWSANGLLLLVAGICWFRSRGRWSRFFFHWCGAIGLNAIGSCLADVAIDRGLYYTGSVYDVPIIASMIWFASIGFYNASEKEAMLTEPPIGLKGNWIARVMAGAIAAAALAGSWSVISGTAPPEVAHFRIYALLAAAASSALLLMARLVVAAPRLRPAPRRA
jgi:hypothetical protein